jgi:hypothetical protein
MNLSYPRSSRGKGTARIDGIKRPAALSLGAWKRICKPWEQLLPEEEISSAMRRRATSTASSASRVPLLQQPQRHCSRSAESSDTKILIGRNIVGRCMYDVILFVLRSRLSIGKSSMPYLGKWLILLPVWSRDTKFARNPYWHRPRRAGGTLQ